MVLSPNPLETFMSGYCCNVGIPTDRVGASHEVNVTLGHIDKEIR